MKTIKTVGVVGAGTMGSALAQKFAQEGFKVILADREMKFVERGLHNIKTMLDEGVQRKVFTPEQVSAILANITGTGNLQEMKVCDLIIEAIFENFDAKAELFKTLARFVSKDTILATNTSSFSVSELAEIVSNPERFIGLHFFYHAAKNRLVEIIPGAKTSKETYEALKVFSVQAGKDAITCKDEYGFAVNRFFVPWLNEAVHLLEEKAATMEEIDAVCMKVFGIGMGPFALMNATKVEIAYHAEKTLEIFGNAYKVAELLKKQAESGKEWEIKTTEIQVAPDVEKVITERMLGIVFFVCSQIIETKVCSAVELNRGARIGLRWRKGPVDLMMKYKEQEVKRFVQLIATQYKEQAPAVNSANWKMEFITLEKSGNRAIITMLRPEDMNALNEETVGQLAQKFDDANNDKSIETIFLIGSGKAFVAGADIKFFVTHMKANALDKIQAFTEYGQKVCERIDNSPKKVVVMMNGLALGGGLELALCADVILASPKAAMAFPETGIGIYPGLGGTQRSAKRVGKGLSKYLIHTGKMLSAKDAESIGLIDKVISTEEMFDMLSGKTTVPVFAQKTLNGKWKAISDFFENNSLDNMLEKKYSETVLSKEEADKLVQTIGYKAPIAVRIADKLIDEAKGCASELEHLKTIFSTSDAMLGLTSIGKKVVYQGK